MYCSQFQVSHGPWKHSPGSRCGTSMFAHLFRITLGIPFAPGALKGLVLLISRLICSSVIGLHSKAMLRPKSPSELRPSFGSSVQPSTVLQPSSVWPIIPCFIISAYSFISSSLIPFPHAFHVSSIHFVSCPHWQNITRNDRYYHGSSLPAPVSHINLQHCLIWICINFYSSLI